MAGRNTYDIPRIQREILEHRAQRRQILRTKHLEEVGNPYRNGIAGHVEDEAYLRFQSLRTTAIEFFRPTTKNAAFFLATVVFPTVFITWAMVRHKEKCELELRQGKISYRDREYKFF